MNKSLSLTDLQKIARKAALAGHFPKKEVKISSKPDFVDRTLERAERVIKRMQQY